MVLRTLKIPEVPNEVGLNIELLETLGGGGGVNIWCCSFNSELLEAKEVVTRRSFSLLQPPKEGG